MNIKDVFKDNNFILIDQKESPENFGNYEISYKKDGIIFYFSSDRGQKFLELKKENGKERISAPLLFNSDEVFSVEKIIKCLTDDYSELAKRMNDMTDEAILQLKIARMNRWLNRLNPAQTNSSPSSHKY